MSFSIHDTDPTVRRRNVSTAGSAHNRFASCRLFDAIQTRQWDLAIDRVSHCPGETSQWAPVVLRGCSAHLLPLHYACTLRPPTRLIGALIDADPDTVLSPDDSGRLPIHWAVDAAGSSREVVNLLLEAFPNGAKCRENKWGFTPLHICCYSSSENAVESSKDQLQIVELLLKANPAAVSCKDNKGWLPIHIAARTGSDRTIAQRLVHAYPKGVREFDSKGRLPLHLACMVGRGDDAFIEMIRFLIDSFHGALCTKEKHHAFLPLHMACSAPYVADSLIKLLLERYPGAIKKTDAHASLPLHLAVRSRAPTCVVKRLLANYPAGAMQLDQEGRLALHWACKMCFSVATIKMLINAYPGSIFVRENKYGYTSLAIACMSPLDESVFDVLLSRSRAVASVADKHGALPLHLACNNYDQLSSSIVKRLIEAYPQATEATDKEGRTPADVAALVINTDQRKELQRILDDIVAPRSLGSDLIADHISSLKLDTKSLKALRSIDGNTTSDGSAQGGGGACVICLDNKATHVLIPCGHYCICDECAKTRLEDLHHICPIGRCIFSDSMKVFGVQS